MRSFLAALQFLTTLPVPVRDVSDRDLGRSAAVFPLVGLFLGALGLGAYLGLSRVVPPTLARLLAYVVLLLLSSAFHLDGLSDAVDGLYGGRSRADALRIMKDPHVGAMGSLALIVVVLLKVVAGALLPEGVFRGALLAVPTAGHAAMVLCLSLPYARAAGLGGAFDRHRTSWASPVALLLAALVAAASLGLRGLLALLVAVIAAVACLVRAQRRLGGYTGDICGAVAELAEAACLVAICAFTSALHLETTSP
jgi:adenosylcobinamide-GDP ribazoletransferase